MCLDIANVYLLKTKDNALNCFKTYKAKVENQLEKKIKCFRSDHGGEYFSLMSSTYSMRNMSIYTRGRRPIRPNQTRLSKGGITL
jgi:hypothetical protein